MKPNKTIREMDSLKLLKEFEKVVDDSGSKRYDMFGNIMPRYNKNKIKMIRSELLRRLGIIKQEENLDNLIYSIDTSEPEEMREVFEGFSFDKEEKDINRTVRFLKDKFLK